MIRIRRGTEPRGFRTAGLKRLTTAVKAFNRHGVLSTQLKETLTGYGSKATKKTLFDAQQEKCAWCERHTDFSSAPIEHYRPKDGAWRHLPGEALRIDAGHYWWLTWTWSNLLFSCARCNDAGHKANYFPLRSKTVGVAAPRAPLPVSFPSPVVDVSTEQPLLLDPTGNEDPLDHIEWLPGNTRFARSDWIWTPSGRTEQGRATILILKLEELAGRAQGHVRTHLLPSIEEVEQHITAGRIAAARRRWNQLLETSLAPSAEWSAFTWCALAQLVPGGYRRRHALADPPRPGA